MEGERKISRLKNKRKNKIKRERVKYIDRSEKEGRNHMERLCDFIKKKGKDRKKLDQKKSKESIQ